MLYIIRYCLICTFLCAPFFSKAQIELGDSLFTAGDFNRAFIAYEYALFKGTSIHETNSLLLKSAYSLKHAGKYEQARKALDRADFYSSDDSLRSLLFYEYVINSLLAGKYDMALSKLEEMRYEIKDTLTLQTILPLEIIALNELQRWSEAHVKYLQLTGASSYADPYIEILSFKMKNPDKAMTLSYWLPGVGQMYAGYFWKGFVSSLLNAGLVGFSAWSFMNGYYFSGAFSGVALFYLSYNGGARYAEVLAKRYNEEKIQKFNAKVKSQILETAINKESSLR